MTGETQTTAELPTEFAALAGELYAKSGAAAFGLALEKFAAILKEASAKYLPAGAGRSEQRELYLCLRVEELALAHACAAGHERAWEAFMSRYREKLYDMASYITKESGSARELADSLYADLYGAPRRDGQRVSKLSSYMGRGSLEGWLRTVLAQEFVNRYRKHRRLVSLDEESEEGAQFAAPDPTPAQTVDPRVEEAADECLAALCAEDRFLLAAYYLDGRTLATIAASLGVHESTISRKLDKLAKSLRKQVLAALGRRGMARRQAQEAIEVDVRDLHLNIRARLTQESPAQAFPKQKISAREGG